MGRMAPAFGYPVFDSVGAFASSSKSRLRLRPVVACHESGVQSSSHTFEDGQDRSGGLIQWALRNGIRLSSVSIREVPLAGRGVVADNAITRSTTAIGAPGHLALQEDNFRGSRPPRYLNESSLDEATWRRAPWWARMAVRLLSELDKGPDSPLYSWLNQLPQTFNTPLHWTDDQLAELHYDAVVQTVDRQRREILALHRGLFKGSGVTLDQFTWAVECVRSRAFSGAVTPASFQERLPLILFLWTISGFSLFLQLFTLDQIANGTAAALVSIIAYDFLFPRILSAIQGDEEFLRYSFCPVIDMINHNPQENARVAYEYFYDRFVVILNSDISPNEEIRISYGNRSNDQLLCYHGFVIKGNPDDIYVLAESFNDLIRRHPNSFREFDLQQLETVLMDGLGRRGTVFLARNQLAHGAFDQATMEAFRMLHCETRDFLRHRKSNFFRKAQSPETEKRVRHSLYSIVQGELRISLSNISPSTETVIGRMQGSFREEKLCILREALQVLSQ
uniref:SET domain-containing protein n=1 Tax=Compsopogon caeruleus TaxID=31354 RepID=A0A7S1TGF7_9RHOD|mmetsp:Transcript_5057/g.10246  ORF Transcript_5057/g.10246 Transcript_5057/m.10246 type:complete len:507 (+) Transcript_5057:514-2034(+)